MNSVLTFVCPKGHRGLKKVCFCGLATQLENLCKPPSLPVQKVESKPNKFGAKTVTIDGILFDSTAEGAYYLLLRELEEAGEVVDLVTQHPIAIRGENGKRIGLYNADFAYRNRGREELVIVDVKGRETAVFRLKRKMLEAQGVTVQVVTAEDIPPKHLELAKEIRESGLGYSTRKK